MTDFAWRSAGIGANDNGTVFWDHVKIPATAIQTVEASRLSLARYGFQIAPLEITFERISIFNTFTQTNEDPPAAVFYHVPWRSEDFFIRGTAHLRARVGSWDGLTIKDADRAREDGVPETIADGLAGCPFHLLFVWPGLEGNIDYPSGPGIKARLRTAAASLIAPFREALPEDVTVHIPYVLTVHSGRGGRPRIRTQRFAISEL